MSSTGMGRDVLAFFCFLFCFFVVFHSALPLLTALSPTLQDAPEDGFGEAVLAFDMPEPCRFHTLVTDMARSEKVDNML